MKEGDPSARLPYEFIRLTQVELERRGYFFSTVEREHAEGLITEPMAARLRGLIKRRGFGKVAGRTILTFSGYDADPREIYEIPEIRAYTEALDAEVPELPALVAFLPELRFNGPGLWLMLKGQIGEQVPHPERGSYDVQVLGAPALVADGLRRIREAATRYHLPHNDRIRVEQTFVAGTRFRSR